MSVETALTEFLTLAAPVFEAMLSAAVYSVLWYARRREQGEAFDPLKLYATVLVGAFVGALLVVFGADVSRLAVTERLVAYAGLVSLVEAVLKWALERGRRFTDDRDTAPDGGEWELDALDALVGERCPRCDRAMSVEDLDYVGGGWVHVGAGDPHEVDLDEVRDDRGIRTDGGYVPPKKEHMKCRGSCTGRTVHVEVGEAGTTVECMACGERRRRAATDGGRRFTTNPETCSECGERLRGGECPECDESD